MELGRRRRNFEIMRKDVSAAHSAADTWGSISLRCRANKGRSACSHPSYSMPHKERSRLLLLIIALPHLERARVLACLQKSQAMRRSTLPPPVAPRRLRRTLSSYDEVHSTPAAAAAAFCAGKPSPLQTSPPLIHQRDTDTALPFHRRPSCVLAAASQMAQAQIMYRQLQEQLALAAQA